MELYLDFISTINKVYYPKEPKRSRKFNEKRYRTPPPLNLKLERYFAMQSTRIVGEAILEINEGEQEQNPEFVDVNVTVYPSHTQKGIGKLLFRKLIKSARKHKKTKFSIFILEGANEGIAESWLRKLMSNLFPPRPLTGFTKIK